MPRIVPGAVIALSVGESAPPGFPPLPVSPANARARPQARIFTTPSAHPPCAKMAQDFVMVQPSAWRKSQSLTLRRRTTCRANVAASLSEAPVAWQGAWRTRRGARLQLTSFSTLPTISPSVRSTDSRSIGVMLQGVGERDELTNGIHRVAACREVRQQIVA